MIYAKISTYLIFLFIVVVIWYVPKDKLYSDPNITVLKDLRIWATLLLFVQSLLYIVF
ncbi:MAG: hypothetical protein SFU98_07915 [Leptospiraceae bacterium]|nr:hypothetical protein [Leptospiraceae bacterium]